MSRKGYYSEMGDERRETAAIAPPDEAALVALWNRCHESGEHAAAIEALGKAIAADGGAARYHYMLGCTLQDAARTAEAIAAYRRALELDPALAKAHNNLGCLLEAAGDLDAAEGCYDRALRADPGLANALHNLDNVRKRRRHAAQREPLRLHVGGEQVKAGWKILNVRVGEGVDYVGDCCDLGRFEDGSVEEIYASHVLEHLGYVQKLPRSLAEFHRVLAPGGVLRISVPDFEVLCRLFLDPRLSAEERFHVMRMAFGGQTDPYDFHQVGLTYEFLGGYLQAAGFPAWERVPEFGLFDDDSALRMRGSLISLNVVARK